MMDLKGAHEWVVTTKLGSSDVRPGTTPTVTRNCRMYAGEMAMSGAQFPFPIKCDRSMSDVILSCALPIRVVSFKIGISCCRY